MCLYGRMIIEPKSLSNFTFYFHQLCTYQPERIKSQTQLVIPGKRNPGDGISVDFQGRSQCKRWRISRNSRGILVNSAINQRVGEVNLKNIDIPKMDYFLQIRKSVFFLTKANMTKCVFNNNLSSSLETLCWSVLYLSTLQNRPKFRNLWSAFLCFSGTQVNVIVFALFLHN